MKLYNKKQALKTNCKDNPKLQEYQEKEFIRLITKKLDEFIGEISPEQIKKLVNYKKNENNI